VSNQPWDVIVSSSLKRCVCFAEQLAKTAELPLLVNHDLKEMYFGEWEGISTQQIYETSPKRKFIFKIGSALSSCKI
ncbi:histidine phosphatase family protein, partial [Acinetobacter baumannii]